MNPLKQGLKLTISHRHVGEKRVFIHESIKTRVETTGKPWQTGLWAGLYP